MEEQDHAHGKAIIGVVLILALAIIVAFGWYASTLRSSLEQPEPVASEPAPEEVPQSPRQWTAPMQRWLQAGNRLVVDYVHEDGWCAVAVQRPPETEGGQPTIQCIK